VASSVAARPSKKSGVLDKISHGLDQPDDRVRARIERAAIDLLTDQRESPALERQSTATARTSTEKCDKLWKTHGRGD
jgi:hypothetical protein